MSRLDELIRELCPDGVEHKTLGTTINLSRGVRVVKSQLTGQDKYPVYQNSMKPLGYFNKSNCEAKTTFIISAGAAGSVGYSDVDFWAADDCYCLICPENLNSRYLYHVLVNQQDYIFSQVRKASIPRIGRGVVERISIPIPPLPIQEEIVRILDNFTELTAELTAEFTARKKQYEYYRDSLLTFDDNVKWQKLENCIISLTTGLNPRQFFSLNTDDAHNYYVTIREIQHNTVSFSDKTDRINDIALKLCNNRSNLEVGDVLFSGTGTIGETAVICQKPANWNIKEGVYSIKPNHQKLLSRFLMHLLQTKGIRKSFLAKAAGGTVKSVPMKEIRKLLIPLPPLPEQQRIVDILDRFDTLCNDISSGLPAEIKARQQQYEYYRDKLLTFPKADVEV